MKVLITGAAGQLGHALLQSVPVQLAGQTPQLMLCTRLGGDGLLALDLADAAACRALVFELKPDWVINAGAYTAVDRAEAEPELATAVNADAPGAMAEALEVTGGRLLQLSTDFVFSGRQGCPYTPDQLVEPLGIYGASKAAGEQAVTALDPDRRCILRTSWVYGPRGKNFLLTMLRLMAERTELRVVADQVGCPTATVSLAQACWAVLERQVSGIHHWSDAGAASWYDFAVAISELALNLSLLERAPDIQPIRTVDYPTPAQRPSYSLLECSMSRKVLGLHSRHWRDALRSVCESLVNQPR